jgi:hypothetical protein
MFSVSIHVQGLFRIRNPSAPFVPRVEERHCKQTSESAATWGARLLRLTQLLGLVIGERIWQSQRIQFLLDKIRVSDIQPRLLE